ncbi:MAG: ATP-binding cassette domain-containing protein [Alphaproteobacteria bacterium]
MFLRVKNLEFKVANKTILNKQNFSVSKSKHLIISGSSGSGKTTLMNLMSGLLKPTSGFISFEDNDFSKLTEENIDQIRSKNFGFIFQRLHLIKHLTVEQNILLGLNKDQSPNIDELLDDIGLKNKHTQLAKNLSFGESQRVAIARGIINSPKVIFADEPTSSLDDKNTKKVLELIFFQAKKNNSTIIISSHDERVKKFFKKPQEIKL